MRRIGLLRARRAQQVDEQTVGSGNAFRQLTEESQPRVNIRAFAHARIDEGTVEFRLTWIVHRQKWNVFRIELRPEIKPALLYPALEVALADLIGAVQQRVGGLEQFDGRVFVRNARQRPLRLRRALFRRGERRRDQGRIRRDRKSTRLNSSHSQISYAV